MHPNTLPSDLNYGVKTRNSAHWQNCKDGVEINIKAGLEKNKTCRWEKSGGGEIAGITISKVLNFLTRYIMITFHIMAAAGPNFLQKAKI